MSKQLSEPGHPFYDSVWKWSNMSILLENGPKCRVWSNMIENLNFGWKCRFWSEMVEIVESGLKCRSGEALRSYEQTHVRAYSPSLYHYFTSTIKFQEEARIVVPHDTLTCIHDYGFHFCPLLVGWIVIVMFILHSLWLFPECSNAATGDSLCMN